jgi:outer membrane protein OmpU
MNKLTKVGLSALCGSLATVAAAQAGELSVSGGATVTWVSNEGTETGNPIGLSSGIAFAGSGELDNGTTFSLALSNTDQSGYSVGKITLDTPSMGQIIISQATGGVGIDVKDDAMPTAWEETDGTGLTVGQNKISGVGGSMALQWKSPSVMGSTIAFAYAPRNNGKLVNDKNASGSAAEQKGKGWDVLLDLNTAHANMLPNIFAGYSTTERTANPKSMGTNLDDASDIEEAVAGATFVIGPVKFGAQASVEWLGNEQTATDVAGYRNVAYGISFNVSDDLSISWGKNESKKGFVSSNTNGGAGTQLSDAESLQLAYTIGGASIKIAQTEVDNAQYVSGTGNDRDGTTIALSLAF